MIANNKALFLTANQKAKTWERCDLWPIRGIQILK